MPRRSVGELQIVLPALSALTNPGHLTAWIAPPYLPYAPALRTALMGAIQRFEPKTLEAELEKNAGGLGLNCKAKLWEKFAAYQQKLEHNAKNNFNNVFD